MARPLRIEFPEACYYITSRSNPKEQLFGASEDYEYFLKTVEATAQKFKWKILGYCLIPDRYYLLAETAIPNLSKGMRQINSVYTQYINKKNNRYGHLFWGRYKSIVFQKNIFLPLLAQEMALKPVKKHLAKNPIEWCWSSYKVIMEEKRPFRLTSLDAEWLLPAYNQENYEMAKLKFKLETITSMNKVSPLIQTKGQCLLGDDDFVKKLLPYIQDKLSEKEYLSQQRNVFRPSLEELFPIEIQKTKILRNKAILAAVYTHDYSQKQVADFLHIHYSSISRIIAITK